MNGWQHLASRSDLLRTPVVQRKASKKVIVAVQKFIVHLSWCKEKATQHARATKKLPFQVEVSGIPAGSLHVLLIPSDFNGLSCDPGCSNISFTSVPTTTYSAITGTVAVDYATSVTAKCGCRARSARKRIFTNCKSTAVYTRTCKVSTTNHTLLYQLLCRHSIIRKAAIIII